jgi:tetratricopeptide (TPR) repeat protein
LTYDSKLREQMVKDPEQAKLIYPEMDADTVLFGGTDPGRFNPTYMIYCESFIPSGNKPHDPTFDRRDVYLITQNALADGTYLSYIRAHYNRSTQPDPYFFSELVRGDKERALNYTTNVLARAMLPIDRYFTKLGDDIEKRRRVGESYFKGSDFIGLKEFAAKLKPGPQQSPLSKYLFDNLSKETQSALSSGGDEAALRRALSKDLNAILDRELEPDAAKRKTLYDAERFKGIELTARTQRFLKQIQEIRAARAADPKGTREIHTPVRLARQLLEEAYPKEIARSLGGVYPDLEIHTPSNDDSQKCFQDYLGDAQRRLEHDKKFPNEQKQVKQGEDVRYEGGKVQVSGQVAVMAINALLTKVIFDANPDHEFYVEESFPLDWMYPHLTPYGIIMKINRQELPELGDDIVRKDHEFWSKFSDRLIGNWIKYETPLSEICDFADKVYYRRDYRGFKGDPKFIRDNDAQKAFSKLRSSISGVYSWRIGTAGAKGNAVEQQRMLKEAEFAFKQAYAFCPYSPEAVFRYVNLLIGMGRIDDAMLLATTSRRLDPNNGQMENLVNELDRIKRSQAITAQQQLDAMKPQIEASIAQLEQQLRLTPTSAPIVLNLITNHLRLQRPDRALQVLEAFAAQPNLDAAGLAFAASAYGQFQDLPKMEAALARLAALSPEDPEAWYNLASARATINKPKQSLESLKKALQLNKQRLAKVPTASNLWLTAGADSRFDAMRPSPEFKQLLVAEAPK